MTPALAPLCHAGAGLGRWDTNFFVATFLRDVTVLPTHLQMCSMPKIVVKVEGTTKMIKSVLVNLKDVAAAIGRPEDCNIPTQLRMLDTGRGTATRHHPPLSSLLSPLSI
jgi:hypothetical protein